MKILILGGAGMIGQKLLSLILQKKEIKSKKVSEITLFDIINAPYPENSSIPIITKSGDISDPKVSNDLILSKPDIIFHLAAIVSGQAEQEFDLGVGIQEFATCDRNLLTLKTLVGREKYSEALELIEAIRNGQEDLISLMNYKKYELMDSGDNVLLVRAIDTVIDKLKVMPLQIEAKLKELT